MSSHSTIDNRLVRELNAVSSKLYWNKLQSSDESRIVVFVGAGASVSAGFPLGQRLKDEIRDLLIAQSSQAEAILNGEIKRFADSLNARHRRKKASELYSELTLFEFAAIVSRLAVGDDVIKQAIHSTMTAPKLRPLAYELLAHLAKHRYLDHFVILNFDDLLDDAINDELQDRAYIVGTPDDLPSRGIAQQDWSLTQPCIVARPFGTLAKGVYRITTEDVNQFSPYMADFLLHQALGETNNLSLLLVGYSASEPAFTRLIQDASKQCSSINITTIDPDQEVSAALDDISKQTDVSLSHIRLEADDALEIILTKLFRLWSDTHAKSNVSPVWIPVSRHLLLAKCGGEAIQDSSTRVETEILLQAVKSRDFVHLETFSHIHRINKCANLAGPTLGLEMVKNLVEAEILRPDSWDGGIGSGWGSHPSYVPNYMLADRDKVIERLLEIWNLHDQNVTYWGLEGDQPIERKVPASDYVKEQLIEIEKAPEVEIVPKIASEHLWYLGEGARPIRRFSRLAIETRDLLEKALVFGGDIHIYGLWSTGEWLFGSSGWARDIGDRILSQLGGPEEPRGPVRQVELVISRPGGARGKRSEMRDQVMHRLDEHSSTLDDPSRLAFRTRPWYEMNRVMTLIKYYSSSGTEKAAAIYMTRRLGTPLVAPLIVDRARGTDYLFQVWQRYWNAASGTAGARSKAGFVP